MIDIRHDKIVVRKKFEKTDRFTAECIGMTVDINDEFAVGDLKCISPKGIKDFLEYSFPQIFSPKITNSPNRDMIYDKLRNSYTDIYNEFYEKYEHVLPVHSTGEHMMKHQRIDLIPLVYQKDNLLAWEQGVGKTVEMYAISRILNIETTLVVCPAFVKRGWYKELVNEWGEDSTVFTIFDSSHRKTIRAFFEEKFIVVNYEILNKFYDQITDRNIGHIIYDEVHKIKGIQTISHKASQKIINKFPNAKITMASGTPVSNRMNDLYAYLKLANHPLGRDKNFFDSRYLEIGARGKIVGIKNEDELNINISSFMFRRTRNETLSLPPNIIHKCYFPLDEYKEEYDKIMLQIQEGIRERAMYVSQNKDVIKEFEELRYTAALMYSEKNPLMKEAKRAMKDFKTQNYGVLEKYLKDDSLRSTASINSLNIITSMAKVDGVLELIENIIESGEKVAVFGGYHKPLKTLFEKTKGRSVMITGEVSTSKRNIYLERFVSDPNCHIYLANFEAGGVGINGIQHVCSNVIVLNMPFVPKDVEQALARLSRKGQKKAVNVYYAMCEDSIDETLFQLVSDKSNDINAVVNRDKKVEMVYDDIQDILFANILNKIKNEPKTVV